MPPKIKVTKEEIVEASFDLIRNEGKEAFSARNIAKKMGISTQPIFKSFVNMEELLLEVKQKALHLYHQYLDEGLKMDKPFKGTGIKYIEFAKKEPKLFHLLFMDSISQNYDNVKIETKDNIERQNALIASSIGCTIEEANLIQLESWVFVHGIATMIVTNTVSFDDEIISNLLNHYYQGLIRRK